MYTKKCSIKKFLHACQTSPVVGVFHFNSLSVQNWKILKNEVYKIDTYAKLVVIHSQGTKKQLEQLFSQELSSLCTGPTCFLLCSSFASFQALLVVLKQHLEKQAIKAIPGLTFIGAKYDDTFITHAHLPVLQKVTSEPSKLLIVKTPAIQMNTILCASVLKLLTIFKANNGN